MGFLSNGGSTKERTVVVLDIGSGSVGAALVKIPSVRSGAIPHIVTSARTPIGIRESVDFQTLLSDMVGALSATLSELSASKTGTLDEIVCVLASPWYLSETRMLKMSRDKSFIFTKRQADELLEKEVVLLGDIYQKKYGVSEGVPEIVEHHIVGVSLNGYEIDEPFGKRTRSVEMNMIISLAPKVCLDAIRAAIEKIFHHTPVSFSSFAVSSYIAVRDKYVSPDSYLLLDVGGEVTDISIVSKGILKESLSFPFGTHTFYKSLCVTLDVQMRDAEELFELYRTGALDESRKPSLESALARIESTWGESLRQSIALLPHTIHLPNTIFLTTDGRVRSWFAKAICNEEYIKSLVTDHTCKVLSLDGPEFLSMCSVEQGTCDPFLMIEAIAIQRKTNI